MITPLLYLAGPYRAGHDRTIDDNIASARRHARHIARIGVHYPVTPHLNTAHFDGLASDDFFINGTMELMLRCDAVLMLPGWESSEGAEGEATMAAKRAMMVFYDLDAYCRWAKNVHFSLAARLSFAPDKCSGAVRFVGTRILAETIRHYSEVLKMSDGEIIDAYPDVTPLDIRAACKYDPRDL